MNRKVTACGFLYVAPPNLDFSLQSHSAKRWQRRWFTLFDSGELTWALDNNVSEERFARLFPRSPAFFRHARGPHPRPQPAGASAGVSTRCAAGCCRSALESGFLRGTCSSCCFRTFAAKFGCTDKQTEFWRGDLARGRFETWTFSLIADSCCRGVVIVPRAFSARDCVL
ncbi:hypothetical protein ANCDUO_12366 [Ancylostoma duodenale]|uniref:PH domain-containing protein n=1 Tax=Ancylostoma duodenale TaxID=51022 RepID=A0A0C2CLL5_9BILA|nr:hypothetical protein ANCDUO_12366 [Ancylostoma duodenale]